MKHLFDILIQLLWGKCSGKIDSSFSFRFFFQRAIHHLQPHPSFCYLLRDKLEQISKKKMFTCIMKNQRMRIDWIIDDCCHLHTPILIIVQIVSSRTNTGYVTHKQA